MSRVTANESAAPPPVDSGNVTDIDRRDGDTLDIGNTADAVIETLESLFGPRTPEEKEWNRRLGPSQKSTHCFDCEHEYSPDEPIVFGKLRMPPYPWSITIRYWQVTRCRACADLPGYSIPYQCKTCGRDVYGKSYGFRSRYRAIDGMCQETTPHAFCSDLCGSRHYNALRRQQRLKNRQKRCAQCGEDFTGARSDSRYCSKSCKQKAYRQRNAAAGE